MRRKSVRSAIVAAGAVAALQLAYFTVTSGPGCALVAGSKTACMQGNLAVAGIGVVMMLIAMTWGFRLFVGLESAALGTLLTVSGVYAVVRVGAGARVGRLRPGRRACCRSWRAWWRSATCRWRCATRSTSDPTPGPGAGPSGQPRPPPLPPPPFFLGFGLGFGATYGEPSEG